MNNYGPQDWFQNNQLNGEDISAIIFANGTIKLDQNFETCREIYAVYADGTQEWYQKNLRHRKDGPAVIRADGKFEWYLNGKQIFMTGLNTKSARNCPID